MIGLHAGPVFVEAVREVGIGLLVAGAFVTLVPQFLELFVGRYVLRMNPLLLLGALSGAQTMAAALAAIPRQSGCDERVNQDEKTRLDFGMIVAISDFCNA